MPPTALTLLKFSPQLFGGLIAGFVLLTILVALGKVPLGYSIRNLKVRWRTTSLTALAFTLVVGLLVVMLAFVNGMYELTENSGQPGNVIVLSDGATDELFSNLGFTDTADVERQPGVMRDDEGRALCTRETYLVVNQPVPSPAEGRPKRRFIQVRGIEDPVIAGRVHGLDLFPGGQWFSEAGVQALPEGSKLDEGEREAIQAVLGEGVARTMGQDVGKQSLEVGDLFQLGGRTWIVVGILKSEGSTFGSEVWAKWSLVTRMFGKERYTSIVLRTPDNPTAAALAKDLTTNFRKAALQAMTETEYFSRLGETNQQLLVAIAFVTAVMAIGGVFGVMNTMFAAVAARRRDIGVLRIIGFARWQVLAVFLVESLLIALIGGALGCALGYMADGWSANSIVSGGQGGGKSVALKLIVSADTLAVGLLVALAMGGLGGLFPALSAMRQRPLESVR